MQQGSAQAALFVTTCRCAGAMKNAPWLLGASRKGFLGKLTNQSDPTLRDFATVSACTAGVSAGADMIRVHNWQAGIDAARVSDVLLRHR